MHIRRIAVCTIALLTVTAPAGATTFEFNATNQVGVYSSTYSNMGGAYVVDTKADKKAATVYWTRNTILKPGSKTANGGLNSRALGAVEPGNIIRTLRQCVENSNPFDKNQCGSTVLNPFIFG